MPGPHVALVSKWSHLSAAGNTPPQGYPAGRVVTPASPVSPPRDMLGARRRCCVTLQPLDIPLSIVKSHIVPLPLERVTITHPWKVTGASTPPVMNISASCVAASRSVRYTDTAGASASREAASSRPSSCVERSACVPSGT